MPLFSTKDANLRQLGFRPLASYASWDYPVEQHEPGFLSISDVRYVHPEPAADNTRLYAYAWVEGPGLLLATERHISTNQHIVAELETDDPLALRQQVEAFFYQHGRAAS